MPRPKLSFTVTDDMRQLMDAARAGFLQDTSLAVGIARAGAVLAAQRGHPLEREEMPAPSPAHECPGSHAHGSTLCLERHGCRCGVCEQAKAARAAERRAEAAQGLEPRPVVTTYTTPSKTATEGQQQGAYVPGSRPITSRVPIELPEGVEHGTAAAYDRSRCRCSVCRSWKSQVNARYNARRAERAALKSWTPREDDDA